MPRGVKVYTIRPLVVDELTTRSVLPGRRLPLSRDVDGMEREFIPLRDYDIVINECHRVRKTASNLYYCERFYASSDARLLSVNFYCFNFNGKSVLFDGTVLYPTYEEIFLYIKRSF